MPRIMQKVHIKLPLLVAIFSVVAIGCPASSFGAETCRITRSLDQIHADWLRQAQLRNTPPAVKGKAVTPQMDAAGACDGVINGKWGFHTEREPRPWWQVDLGQVTRIGRIVVYNRCDIPARASRMIVLLSTDGNDFKKAYQHNGTVFYGKTDNTPLVIQLNGSEARYIRLQLPATDYFHLDEVQVYASDSKKNIAIGRPATQSSISQWSAQSHHVPQPRYNTPEVIRRGLTLAGDFAHMGVEVTKHRTFLRNGRRNMHRWSPDDAESLRRCRYIRARSAIRKMALANPLLNFRSILFVKRAPGALPHMSDQFYGWWSRPGGGICILDDFATDRPTLRCLTEDWPPGNFLRPDLSFDAKRILFAYCRYYPRVAAAEKVDKDQLPADAFYNIYEMRIDGTGVRQLTHGRYDDFDARYLPDGRIVFLSTRKGQFVRYTEDCSRSTTSRTLPDSYVRCGGDNKRPCAVYTLHTMDADGANIRPISAFENFEWTPTVAPDGRILYARWDYIDRFNGHFMSLWSTNQDGTNPNLFFGNYTTHPQCIFEAVPIPDSDKLVFTAAAHHSIVGGALALLDRNAGTEGAEPITRLTPEVCFPEIEGWPPCYYANPYPLSEKYFLVTWSNARLPPHRGSQQVTGRDNPTNSMGIYLYDAFGNLELLYRDAEISSMNPIPVRPRPRPAVHSTAAHQPSSDAGRVLLQDVYEGLEGIERGAIKRLRIVGVPPKVQPHMNTPHLGVSKEDPGKFVLGTVPVESDGSAYFHLPAGVPVFFQALNEEGLAIQTMRSLTYTQPRQTLSCIGCHEHRHQAPPVRSMPLAAMRSPSRLTPGPEGSWPLRFDRLVQPVLDESCVRCHSPQADDPRAAAPDLTAPDAYRNLLAFADNDLHDLAFERDRSHVGRCVAQNSKLYALLTESDGHEGVRLTAEQLDRIVTWMDLYAHRLGSFSPQQEQQLVRLRQQLAELLNQ